MAISLIPRQEFTIVCFKPKDEVIRLLRENTEIRDEEPTILDAIVGTTDVPFYGRITGERFNIARKTSFRNDFKPDLEGRIIDNNHKAYIEVTAQANIISVILMVVVCAGLIISVAFSEESLSTLIGIIAAIGMTYVVWMLVFSFGVHRARKILLEITRGEIAHS